MSSRVSLALLCLLSSLSASIARADLVTFEDLGLPANSEWHGPDPAGTTIAGPFGPVTQGSFTSGGVAFENRFDQTFGSWSGFGYSSMTDNTTPGFGNQFSAYPGGAQGGTTYGIASGYDDLVANLFDAEPFDPLNVTHLLNLPHFTLPTGASIVSAFVSNMTWPALAMLNGDAPSKQFGGASGNDPDWFKLSAFGIDSNGQALGTEVEFYLADYRFADNTQDYIVDSWELMDLSSLAGARTIAFNLSSSDVGLFGMNTPGSFAIDSISFSTTSVPEPGSAALLLAGVAVAGGLQWRRRRVEKSKAASSMLDP